LKARSLPHLDHSRSACLRQGKRRPRWPTLPRRARCSPASGPRPRGTSAAAPFRHPFTTVSDLDSLEECIYALLGAGVPLLHLQTRPARELPLIGRDHDEPMRHTRGGQPQIMWPDQLAPRLTPKFSRMQRRRNSALAPQPGAACRLQRHVRRSVASATTCAQSVQDAVGR
jgi:hypothetical protein